MSALIHEPELMEKTGYRTRASLRAWMAANGIAYLPGKGGAILTTTDAFNKALGLAHTDAHQAANDAGAVEIL